MHRRFVMPKPEMPVIEAGWNEHQRRSYLKQHETAYLKEMKGGLFLQALAAEIKADEEQTDYALRTFYKCYLKQKEVVMEWGEGEATLASFSRVSCIVCLSV